MSHSVLHSEAFEESDDIKDNIIEHYEEEYLNEDEDYDRFERSDESEEDSEPSPSKRRKSRKRRSSSSTGIKIKKERSLTCKLTNILFKNLH